MRDILIYTASDGEKQIINMNYVSHINEYNGQIYIYFNSGGYIKVLGNIDDFIESFKYHADTWILKQKPIGENQE